MSDKGRYVLAVDQSTQGTKAFLFDGQGAMAARADRAHRQIIDSRGYVEHDPEEILKNTLAVCADVIDCSGIEGRQIAAMGITNQRETSVAWNRKTGKPLMNAIVWQCARAAKICERHRDEAEDIRRRTGLTLSPYFPAAKMQWIMENVPEAGDLAKSGDLALGTVDAWLLQHLTKEHVFRTDCSNASRTQLLNLHTLRWDETLLEIFGIPVGALPEVVMSDSVFGTTDLGGLLPEAVPVCAVMGDSHAALFGQGCRKPGQLKATYGTGSSVMMNIGTKMKLSDSGLVTSLAWGFGGQAEYVFEGNLNYTGAVISWLKDSLGLIDSAAETSDIAKKAVREDRTYFVPAFTGLGSPYWDPDATGMFTGITRTTGRNELVRACVECIAYQITDLIDLMRADSGLDVSSIRVDGGPTANEYLMQFQSDIANARVQVPSLNELSAAGVAFMAGITAGLYDPGTIGSRISYKDYIPQPDEPLRLSRLNGWKQAVRQVLTHERY